MHEEKRRNKQYQTLTTSLKREEMGLKKTQTAKDWLNKINILKYKINLLEQEMEKEIKFASHIF